MCGECNEVLVRRLLPVAEARANQRTAKETRGGEMVRPIHVDYAHTEVAQSQGEL